MKEAIANAVFQRRIRVSGDAILFGKRSRCVRLRDNATLFGDCIFVPSDSLSPPGDLHFLAFAPRDRLSGERVWNDVLAARPRRWLGPLPPPWPSIRGWFFNDASRLFFYFRVELFTKFAKCCVCQCARTHAHKHTPARLSVVPEPRSLQHITLIAIGDTPAHDKGLLLIALCIH